MKKLYKKIKYKKIIVKNITFAVGAIIAVFIFVTPSNSFAACTDFASVKPYDSFKAVNNNVIETRTEFQRCVRNGSDPTLNLLPRGGRAGNFGTSGAGAISLVTAYDMAQAFCTRSTLKDKMSCLTPDFPSCFGTPGDLINIGAADCKNIGPGQMTPFNGAQKPPVVQSVSNYSGLCAINLALSANLGANGGSICVSAGITAFCGIPLNGSLCISYP